MRLFRLLDVIHRLRKERNALYNEVCELREIVEENKRVVNNDVVWINNRQFISMSSHMQILRIAEENNKQYRELRDKIIVEGVGAGMSTKAIDYYINKYCKTK